MHYPVTTILESVDKKTFYDVDGLAIFWNESVKEIESLFDEGYIQYGSSKIVLTEKGRQCLYGK